MTNLKIRSKFFQFTTLVFTSFVLLAFLVETEAEIVCPTYTVGVTCWCGNINGFNTEIQCHDYGDIVMTQSVIDHTFEEIRSLNNNTDVMEERFIFYLQRSRAMYTFDLTPLMGLNFLSVNINFNPLLMSIQGGNQENPEAFINTPELVLSANLLSDDGLVDTFKYFSPNVEYLDLRKNQIKGTYIPVNDSMKEFLPGLSSFKNLKYLDLSSNNITRVADEQFKSYRNLEDLNLLGNGLIEIGPLAFSLEKPETPFEDEGKRLLINLSRNNLTDMGINANNGFHLTNRPTLLNLEYNKFGYISGENFRKFLEKDTESFILLKENPFYCDLKMNWLKSGKDVFSNKAFDIKCVNDNWKSIFNTKITLS